MSLTIGKLKKMIDELPDDMPVCCLMDGFDENLLTSYIVTNVSMDLKVMNRINTNKLGSERCYVPPNWKLAQEKTMPTTIEWECGDAEGGHIEEQKLPITPVFCFNMPKDPL